MNRGFEEVEVKCRKHPDVKTKLPQRAAANSCGYDFYSKEDYLLAPQERHVFWTDVKAKMFFDNVLQINTRSGNGCKKGIVLANTIGYIDADYYGNSDNDGNIGICLYNTGKEPFAITLGDRIAQGMFTRYYITDDDQYKNAVGDKTSVRKGGFGSTGK